MKWSLNKIATCLFYIFFSLPNMGVAAGLNEYQLAIIDDPITCSSFTIFSVKKADMSTRTAVALYQIIRFAYDEEEVTDTSNSFYRQQFGYNPSDLRINRWNGLITILPLFIEEISLDAGIEPLKFVLDNPNNLNFYAFKDIKADYVPALQSLIAFRRQNSVNDKNYEEFMKKADELVRPFIKGYGIKTEHHENAC